MNLPEYYNVAVIGAGFGDEGKGMTVDSLVSNHIDTRHSTDNLIIVRANGGYQAAHRTVRDGKEAINQHLGSGTQRNIPTYWSKYCPVNFDILNLELSMRCGEGYNPQIYIDKNCPVSTIMDIKYQQVTTNLNMSCGLGVGTTINRNESIELTVGDSFNLSAYKIKIQNIMDYYNIIDMKFMEASLKHREDFLKNIHVNVTTLKDISGDFPCKIFEGAQGLLLDQKKGFFPYVTRSNTGTKNIVELLSTIDESLDKVLLITRWYTTRHGAGPIGNEYVSGNIPYVIENDIDLPGTERNITNKFQGEFRLAPLNLELLEYAVASDEYISKHLPRTSLVITCTDHHRRYHDWYFIDKNNYNHLANFNSFCNLIKTRIPFNTLYSTSKDTANTL